ncbi:hypothetical protein D9M71_476660 [compost metagenome]
MRQHTIEQVAASRREQPRTQVALFRQAATLGEGARVADIVAVMTEALGAEVVRHAFPGDALQAAFQGIAIGFQGSQAQSETIGGMSAALQLATMPHLLEDAQRIAFGRGKIGIGLAWQVQAEPLASQRLAILQPRVTDRAQRNSRRARQTPRRFLGIQAALLHPQPEMLALSF